jgi:hypothetical protein
MKSKEFCNNLYRDLVARLGEIQIQLDRLNKEKDGILVQLSTLNALSPELQKLEEEK